MIKSSAGRPWVWMLLVFLAATVSGCSRDTVDGTEAASEAPVDSGLPVAHASEQLADFFTAHFDRGLERNPLTASYVGRETHKDQWNTVTEAFQEESLALLRDDLVRAREFDTAKLSPSDALSQDLFIRNGERQLALDDFRHERYVIHQFRGPHTRVPSALINVHRVDALEDAESYIGRLNNVATYFNGVIEQLNVRAEKGLLLVDWMYPQMIEAAGNVISGSPFDDSEQDSIIWADFKTKVDALSVESAEKQRLLAEGEVALVESLKPAYQRLIDTLAVQSTAASGDDGVWRFERGADYYQALLKWYTTTDLTADQVHELGLANVERLQNDMRALMKALEFEGSLTDFFVSVRQSQTLRFPNTDKGREQYLSEAGAAIDAMKSRLPDYFGRLPKADLIVKRVEAFREQSAGKAFYQGPPMDGSRPGIYYANLYDMSAMPKTDLEALAFHEGVPGHHLQRALTTELGDIPDFQRYLSFTAFTEGWGLYSEYLAKEMGFYTDPYSEFGRLAMELWRAARLVVDTGIHHKRWTREEAIGYLLDNTPNAESDCVKAIERYIAMPGQATAYMIGKIKILALREDARTTLGDQFDIRQFHDVVLGSGPVPLDVLETNIKTMVTARRGDSSIQ